MKLNGLTIRKNYYEATDGTMVGDIAIEVGGGIGEVKLVLKPEQIQRILNIVAQAVVDSAKEVAKELTTRIIEDQAKALEHKT